MTQENHFERHPTADTRFWQNPVHPFCIAANIIWLVSKRRCMDSSFGILFPGSSQEEPVWVSDTVSYAGGTDILWLVASVSATGGGTRPGADHRRCLFIEKICKSAELRMISSAPDREALASVSRTGIPTALTSLQLAVFALWPFGQEIRPRFLPTTLEELHEHERREAEQQQPLTAQEATAADAV